MWRDVLRLSNVREGETVAFLFSTGPNTEAGGKRATPCHTDIPMRRCSLSLDDEPMTIAGDVIPPTSASRAPRPHDTRQPEGGGEGGTS